MTQRGQFRMAFDTARMRWKTYRKLQIRYATLQRRWKAGAGAPGVGGNVVLPHVCNCGSRIVPLEPAGNPDGGVAVEGDPVMRQPGRQPRGQFDKGGRELAGQPAFSRDKQGRRCRFGWRAARWRRSRTSTRRAGRWRIRAVPQRRMRTRSQTRRSSPGRRSQARLARAPPCESSRRHASRTAEGRRRRSASSP